MKQNIVLDPSLVQPRLHCITFTCMISTSQNQKLERQKNDGKKCQIVQECCIPPAN